MTKGAWIGVGILALAVIIIGVASIMRSSNAPAPVAPVALPPVALPSASNVGDNHTAPAATEDGGAINASASLETPEAVTAPTVVSYSGTGFSPNKISIKVGTTVRFENESSKPVWVASDSHPSHTDLPGFDALRAYGPSETYTYTFATVGTWGFHNHLSHTQTGSVTVTN